MLPIKPATILRWEQPSITRSFHELRSPEGLVATLELRGARGIATTANGRWRLERDVTRIIHVWDTAKSELTGQLSTGSWSGRRTFVTIDGRRYSWEPANFWRTSWRFRAGDRVLLEVRKGHGVLRSDAAVDVAELRHQTAELEVLAVVARYLVLLSDADNGAAAAAAVVGSMPPV